MTSRHIVLLLLSIPAAGQFSNDRLTVSGDAEIKVVPDRVVISVGVETRNPLLQTAKTRNDAAIAAILKATREEQVAADDVQTDFIEIKPVYQGRDSTENRENYLVDYYRVHKAMAITLKDVTRFERLLTAVVAAGANRVYGVDFQTSQLRKYRDQAREMAVKAAMEKAQALAAAAGLRVDKPESISAYQYGGGAWYGRMGHDPYNRMMSNVSQNVGVVPGGSESGGTVSPGRISVTATISLSFKLIP